MSIQPTEGATSATVGYFRLRDDILTGTLAPGAKLRIRDICQRYGIGFNPAREALNRLSMQGLVAQADHKGFTVAAANKEDLIDLTRTRILISSMALREAIEHGRDDWEERVIISLHRLERAKDDYEDKLPKVSSAYNEKHRAFHSALLSACPLPRLLQYCEQTFDQADRYRALLRRVYATHTHLRGPVDHRLIMEATIARNLNLAVDRLTQHYQHTCHVVLTYWHEIEPATSPQPRTRS